METQIVITIKCPECSGTGEREINVDGMDCPIECIFCEGSGYQNVTNDEIRKDIQTFRALASTPASSLLESKMEALLKLVEHRKNIRVRLQKTQWKLEKENGHPARQT